MTGRHAVILLAFLASGEYARAQSATTKPSFDLRPAILDSKEGSGTTLALEYQFKAQRPLTTFGSDGGSSSLDPDATVRQLTAGIETRGVLTPQASRNPRNFLEFNGSLSALVSTAAAGTFSFGGHVGYEADQSFISKQLIYGGTVTYGKLSLLGKNDFVGVSTSYVLVDPTADTLRAAVLRAVTPGATLQSYGRLSVEGLYMTPLDFGPCRALELNVRYFTEPSASSAITRATLDRHVLGTIRIGLANDLFVAYSAGSVPFDRGNDRVFSLGWSYKLK